MELYARRVYALARSRLGGGGRTASAGAWSTGNDAAEEITQSVFCTIAGKLSSGEYTEQGRFESWLFRVAMNRVRDEVRRRRRQAEPTDPENLGRVSQNTRIQGSSSESADADQLVSLRRALELLSESDREVVELRHHAGLSFKQISEMLDEPLGTLLARHHRALKKLKDMMTDQISGSGGTGSSVQIVGEQP